MNTNSVCASADEMAINEYDIWKKTPTSATQEWVASLPISQDTCNSPKEENLPSPENERTTPTSDIPAVPLVTRKIGVQGFYNSSKQNAGDIYQLAIAARKARERQPPGDYGYCNSSTVTPGYLPLKSHLSGSYSKSIHDFREFKTQDRASMLRTAYAAQRYDQPGVSFQSETTAFSLDSSADIFGNEEPDAENLLMQLGFGGPSQGFDRIPERFLQPSQLRGVHIDQFLAIEQELDEAAETGSLGYRGLSGPSTRRPSTIVARLMERMRDNLRDDYKLRKSSSFSTDIPSFCYKNEKNDLISLPEETVSDEQTLSLPSESCATSRKSSFTTSRKSSFTTSRKSSLKSLKRQECVELDDDKIFPLADTDQHEDEDAALLLTSLTVSQDSSGFHDFPQSSTNQGIGLLTILSTPETLTSPPSIYVSSPSIIFSHTAVVESTQSDPPLYSREVDSIISVMQLATEAYRLRMECFPVSTSVALRQEWSDCNHNQLIEDDSAAVKDDIRQELAKTEHLLQCLHERLSHARSANRTYDSSAIRTVLNDMSMLLQQQQRLHQQVTQPDCPRYLESSRRESALEPSAIDTSSSVTSDTTLTSDDAAVGTNSSDTSAEPSSLGPKAVQLSFSGNSWLRGLERRLTSHIRRTVRHEIRKALCSRSKLRKP